MWFKRILIAISLLVLVVLGKDIFFHRNNVLCIDVGHTRIKAGLLPKNPTLNDLKKAQTYAWPSAPWRQHNLDQLFTRTKETPLQRLLKTDPEEISLSIYGPIFDRKIHCTTAKSDLFHELQATLQKATHAHLTLDCDSTMWAIGAIELLRLTNQMPRFPCLAITLGTSVGVALIESPKKFSAIEVWILSPPYERLRPIAMPLGHKEAPQRILGKKYLDSIAVELQYHLEYTHHVYAFKEDICDFIETSFPDLPKIETVLIGGGFSHLLDSAQMNGRKTILLTPKKLELWGVSPDIISLLGCETLSATPAIATQTFPSQKEFERLMVLRD